MTPQELAAIQARINQNPRVQDLLRRIQGMKMQPNVAMSMIRQVLQQEGIQLPHDYFIQPDGTIGHRNFLQRNQDWIGPAAVTAGFALPALLGGGSAGAATGGTGAASQALGMQGLAPSGASSLGSGGAAGALASGAGGAASGLGRFFGGADGMGIDDWIRLGLGGASLVGGALNQQEAPDMSPELRALHQQQLGRFQEQGPLYESMMQLAFGRMPNTTTSGLTMPSLSQAEGMVPQTDPGKYTEDDDLRALLRQQQVRGKLADPLFSAITRLAQGRMPGRR